MAGLSRHEPLVLKLQLSQMFLNLVVHRCAASQLCSYNLRMHPIFEISVIAQQRHFICFNYSIQQPVAVPGLLSKAQVVEYRSFGVLSACACLNTTTCNSQFHFLPMPVSGRKAERSHSLKSHASSHGTVSFLNRF